MAREGDDSEVRCWRAHARMELEDHRGAIADLDHAIESDPTSGEAFHMRSKCKRALGDEAGAREDLQRGADLFWPDALAEIAGPPAAPGERG